MVLTSNNDSVIHFLQVSALIGMGIKGKEKEI
jgi:hypothetical protein